MIFLEEIGTAIVQLLFEWLAKFVPPRATSRFDHISRDELRQRNNWIDITGIVILVASPVCLFLAFVVFPAFGQRCGAWALGLLFGFPAILSMLFIGVATLPQGFERLQEFWRFREVKTNLHVAVLLTLYGAFAILGVVSAFEILA